MATLKTNTLTGTSTAGSIAVTGEGNSTTTNVQQGLCKCWFSADMTGTAGMNDSFNSGTLTDNGTGDLTVAITNNMASAEYSGAGSATTASQFSNVAVIRDIQSSSIRLITGNSNSVSDFDPTVFQINGDLA